MAQPPPRASTAFRRRWRRFATAKSTVAHCRRDDDRLRSIWRRSVLGKGTPACPAKRGELSLLSAAIDPSTTPVRVTARQKMLNDELDAALVEYLLELRSQEGHPQWSAEKVLQLSTAYVHKTNPTLLAEDGGHVTLKLTWANNLLARLYQRERDDGIDIDIADGAPSGESVERSNSGNYCKS